MATHGSLLRRTLLTLILLAVVIVPAFAGDLDGSSQAFAKSSNSSAADDHSDSGSASSASSGSSSGSGASQGGGSGSGGQGGNSGSSASRKSGNDGGGSTPSTGPSSSGASGGGAKASTSKSKKAKKQADRPKGNSGKSHGKARSEGPRSKNAGGNTERKGRGGSGPKKGGGSGGGGDGGGGSDGGGDNGGGTGGTDGGGGGVDTPVTPGTGDTPVDSESGSGSLVGPSKGSTADSSGFGITRTGAGPSAGTGLRSSPGIFADPKDIGPLIAMAGPQLPIMAAPSLIPTVGETTRNLVDLAVDLNALSALYGIVLFGVGLLLLLESRRDHIKRFTPALMLLAGFAFAKAMHEWLQMVQGTMLATQLSASSITGIKLAATLAIVLASMMMASYGLRLLVTGSARYVAPVALLGLWVIGSMMVQTGELGQTLTNVELMARYLLFVPANIIAALGTLKLLSEHREVSSLRAALTVAAGLFVVNGILAVPAIMNASVLLNPAKAIVALGIALALVRVLHRLEAISRKKHDEQRLMEHESLVASGIQQQLLPQEPLVSPELRIAAMQRSARAVGGDWYDYLKYDGGIAFQLGDASGKGMPAALLSSAALSTVAVELQHQAPLPEVFDWANKHLLQRFDDASFATMFLGRATEDGSHLDFINCGHEPPILFKHDEHSWHLLETGHNLPLGIAEGPSPDAESLELEVGDRLLLYSDGLHDVRGKEGEFLEIESIIEWLDGHQEMPEDELIQGLMDFATGFADGDLPDDMTVLVIERGDGAVEPEAVAV